MKRTLCLFLTFWLSLFSIISLSVNASDLSLMKMGNTTTAAVGEPTFPTVGGVTLRLDATDLRGVVAADATIATWDDVSASNFDFTQATEGNKPLYRDAPTGFNGWPAVDFVSSDTVTNASIDPLTAFGASAGTAYAVVRIDSLAADAGDPWTNQTILDIGAARTGIFCYTDTVEVFNYDGTNDATTAAIAVDTTYLIIWRHSGGQLGVAINDGAFTETASGDSQANAGGSIGDNAFDGRIAEIITANEVHDATELADMRTYFNDKYMIY